MINKLKDINAEQKILAAAKKIFTLKGLAGARMQDIADEAGINKALLHYYFRSKDKLFEVIFNEAFTRFLPRLNHVIESDIPLFEKIEKFTGHYIDMAIENPYLPLFVLNEMNKHPEEFFKKTWADNPPKVEILVAQIEKEKKKGLIKNITPPQLVMNMMSLCVFPFVGKPLFKMIMHIEEATFLKLMEERKKEVAKFIIAAIST
jgi:TetR/AcrR family transcriptional regulator